MATRAIDANTRRPCTIPQPIDPNSHSPRNSVPPITSSTPARRTTTKAAVPRASARPISPAMSAISAFASSMWAWSRRTAASRVALICARSPGGALRWPRGAPGRGGGDPDAGDPDGGGPDGGDPDGGDPDGGRPPAGGLPVGGVPEARLPDGGVAGGGVRGGGGVLVVSSSVLLRLRIWAWAGLGVGRSG